VATAAKVPRKRLSSFKIRALVRFRYLVLCLTFVLVGCSGGHTPAGPASVPGASPAPSELVPAGGRIRHVWYVPAGRTVPEVVVGWSYRGRHVVSAISPDVRYALTVWHPDQVSAGSARWTPHTLFKGSPFPFDSTSVRTADVTGDGHRDLLVTIECNGCNHAVAAASVYADRGSTIRRIYGRGFLDGSKGQHVGVPGRVITETAWGAWRGLVWFDEPHYGPQSSICCPDYHVQTFLRWNRGRWRTVRTRKVSLERDNYLGRRPVPAP